MNVSEEFFGGAEPDAPAEPEVEAEPSAEVETAEVEAASPEGDPTPDPTPEPAPSESEADRVARLVAERTAELEKKLAFIEGQLSNSTPQEAPEEPEDSSDYWADPEGYTKRVAQAAVEAYKKEAMQEKTQEQQWQERVNRSRKEAMARYPDYQEVEDAFVKLAETTPGLKDAIFNAENPAEFCYSYIQNVRGVFGVNKKPTQSKSNPIADAEAAPKPQGGSRSVPPNKEPALADDDILAAATAHNKY